MSAVSTQAPRELPPRLSRLIARHHAGGVSEADCAACSSTCCNQSGFAILENVLMMHELYERGELRRDDYDFEPGQSFVDFAFRYFDIWTYPTGRWLWKKDVVLFHPKHLTEDGRIISVPGVAGYYHTRSELFAVNPWLCWGCVFSSRRIGYEVDDDGDAARHCILHSELSRTHLTAKPIDCVFHICGTPRDMKIPGYKLSIAWRRALAVCYPGSAGRFGAMVDAQRSERADDGPAGKNTPLQ